MAKKTTTKLTYEKAMEELQSIIEALEGELVSVDQLSTKVKRAATLVAFCKDKLRDTEDEIDQLLT